MSKNTLREKAIALRKRGFSYSEILRQIPVAKSTLSLWLRSVGLSVPQKQNITEKRRMGQKRGARSRHIDRLKRQTSLISSAQKEVHSLSKRELWILGIALYWAEGDKEKEYRPGSRTSFSNSDPRMMVVFLKWLKECLCIEDKDLIISIYIHESHKHRIGVVRRYWSDYLHKPISCFDSVYYKKNKIKTRRRNTGDLYNGLLRVNIKASSSLNRRIAGWIQGIVDNCGLV